MILLSFIAVCLARGDDPDDVVTLPVAVADHQDSDGNAQSDEHESLLIRGVLRVGNHTRILIQECRSCFLERNAVLASIAGVLLLVRAMRAGRSTHMRQRAQSVAAALHAGNLGVEPGKSRMLDTRREVIRHWSGIQQALHAEGRQQLAGEVARFVAGIPPPRTEREWMGQALVERARDLRRELSLAPMR